MQLKGKISKKYYTLANIYPLPLYVETYYICPVCPSQKKNCECKLFDTLHPIEIHLDAYEHVHSLFLWRFANFQLNKFDKLTSDITTFIFHCIDLIYVIYVITNALYGYP